MTADPAPTSLANDGLARRNALILAMGQAVGGSQASIVITTSGLAGYYLLGEDKSLATLPVTAMLAGVAFGAIPAAMLMRLVGRRIGFMTGGGIGLLGALMSMQAIFANEFWLLVLGSLVGGMAGAFIHQYRFAAADVASEAFKPKAISWVMAGGIFAGIIGPQTVIYFKDLFLPIQFAGAYLGMAILMAISILLLAFVTLPKPVATEVKDTGRPLSKILSQPRFIASAGCAITSYALMSFVMTATPLAMVACGHTPGEAALAIQWHVVAMFAPSFFTGSLIVRFGKEIIVAVGLILLAACASIALAGIELAHFNLALILLGVGWNFGFIGATAMVTDCYRPEERAKAQAANDFIIFGFVGTASLMSGKLFTTFGWETINLIVFPFVLVALVMLFLLTRLQQNETLRSA